jgi:diketogulonate reductase-like aldo/keto reductase
MKPEKVRKACEKSLKDWKMEYFDLYLIHWPFCFKADPLTNSTLYDEHGVAILDESCKIEDTWRAMEELVELGLVKNIGVSNFSIDLIKRILAIQNLKIRPAVNQVELHPYLPQNKLREFCSSHGIVVEAYSSLGSGKEPSLFKDDLIIQLSKDLNLSLGTLLLSWARQKNIPVIPKSCNPSRIAENFNHHELSQDVIDKIDSIQITHRFIDPINFWKHLMPQ